MRCRRAKGWIRIMVHLGTDMLQVSPSLLLGFLEHTVIDPHHRSGQKDALPITNDNSRLAADITRLADMLHYETSSSQFEPKFLNTVST